DVASDDEGSDLEAVGGDDVEPVQQLSHRWQCDSSRVAGTLHQWINDHAVACAEQLQPYLVIANHLRDVGSLSLSAASKLFKEQGPDFVYNSKRFREKLLAVLPIQAVSSSRKAGWLLIPRDEIDTYQGFLSSFRRICKLEADAALRDSFSTEEYASMEQLMGSEEK